MAQAAAPPGARQGVGPEYLLLIVVGVLWGSAFPVIRAGIVAGVPPLLFAGVRYGLTAAFLVPIAIALRARRPSPAELLPAAAFGGLLIIGLYGGLLYVGEESTSGGFAAVLAASASFWSVLFAYALLPRERFGGRELFGLAVGFVGVAVLILPGSGGGPATTLLGSAFVIAAVLSFAAGGVLLRRTVSAKPTLWTLAVQFAVASAFVGALSFGFGEPFAFGRTSTTVPALLYLVAAPSIIGYVLYFQLHHRSGPARANLVVYVGPIVGVLVGLLAFGEGVSAIEVGGMVLIVAGLYLVERGLRRGARPRGGRSTQ